MKGLFRGQQPEEFRKELDGRGVVNLDEKAKKKERSAPKGDLNAFLGEGTTFKGNLTFEGTVRVDGKLTGEIFTKDTLVIGSSAEVHADIHTGSLVVSGTVKGNITAEKKVELHASARLYGNISAPSLTIAEGVVFEGSCTMGKKSSLETSKKVPGEAPPKSKAASG